MMAIHQIKLNEVGITYACSDEQTLLAGMEKLGITGIPVGCRGGGCGVCKVKIVTGTCQRKKMSRVHICEEEEAQGYILACRCKPECDLELEIVGQMKISFDAKQTD